MEPGTSALNDPTLFFNPWDFISFMRGMKVTPHMAQNAKRAGGSAIGARSMTHAGYQLSQRKRETRRRGLRLGQDGGHAPQDPTPWTGRGTFGCSPSRPLPTTSCGCAICCRRRFNPHKSEGTCVGACVKVPLWGPYPPTRGHPLDCYIAP